MRIAYFLLAYRQDLHPAVADQRENDAIWCAQRGYTFVRLWHDQFNADTVRNIAIEKAREQCCDYLLMCDNDNFACCDDNPALASSPIGKMLGTMQKHDAAAVAAPIRLRGDRRNEMNVRPMRPGDVYKAELVGTGLILIDVNKINQIAKTYDGPWFARTYKDKRQSQVDVGADCFFSKILRKHGYSVYVDARVSTIHVDRTWLHYSPQPQSQANTEATGEPPADKLVEG